VVLLGGVKLAAPILVPFLLALFITLVSAPFAIWLYDKGLPRGVAVTITFLLLVVGLLGLGALVGGSINAFYDQLPAYREELASLAEKFRLQLEPLGGQLTDQQGGSEAMISNSVMEAIAAILRSLADVVRILLLVLLIVLFMLFEAPGWQQKLDRMVDDEEQFQRLVHSTHELNTYLAVKSLTSFSTGALVAVMLYLLDVDLPLLWGLLAFLLNYIPSIGSIIAAVPGVLLALLDHGTGTAVGIGVGYLAINLTIGNGIEPRIMGQALGLSPLVVMLSVVFWGWLLGAVGAFLSVPLTMIVKILLRNTEDLAWLSVLLGPSPAPAPGTRLSRASSPPPAALPTLTGDPADSSAGHAR
jgi:predicted PurR-regulated permease PerM